MDSPVPLRPLAQPMKPHWFHTTFPFIHFNTPLSLKKNRVGCNCILSDVCAITLLQSQRQQQFSNTRSACLKSHSWQFGVEMVSTEKNTDRGFQESLLAALHADHACTRVNFYFCVKKPKLLMTGRLMGRFFSKFPPNYLF